MAAAIFSDFTFKANSYAPSTPTLPLCILMQHKMTWPEPLLYLSCIPGVLSGPGTQFKKPDHISMDVTYLNKPKTVMPQQ